MRPSKNVRFKDLPHQEETRQKDEAEPSNPAVDQVSSNLPIPVHPNWDFPQDEDWQQHPLQRQEETLEAHQARTVDLPANSSSSGDAEHILNPLKE